MPVSRPFSPELFRQACGAFATGITVAAVLAADGSPQGLTANSFTSVSLSPPLVLICVDKKASVHEHFLSAAAYTVHVLGEEQRHLSERFAAPLNNRFAGLDWSLTESGAPLIAGCLATLECRMQKVIDGGDHTIFLGAVVQTACREGRPLLYFNSGYRTLGS